MDKYNAEAINLINSGTNEDSLINLFRQTDKPVLKTARKILKQCIDGTSTYASEIFLPADNFNNVYVLICQELRIRRIDREGYMNALEEL